MRDIGDLRPLPVSDSIYGAIELCKLRNDYELHSERLTTSLPTSNCLATSLMLDP